MAVELDLSATPSFARMHPALCLASGLFESYANGGREVSAEKSVLAEQELSGFIYRFEGSAALGINDLRILQGLFLLASKPSCDVEIDVRSPLSETGQQLAKLLDFAAQSEAPFLAKFVPFSISSLAQAAGYASGSGGTRTIVLGALNRLSEITVSLLNGEGQANFQSRLFQSRLISSVPRLETDPGRSRDSMVAALSPAISAVVITGAKGIRYAKLEAREIALLGNSGSARGLHHRLCGFIDPGKTVRVSLKKLSGYAFSPTDNRGTAKRRNDDIRKAMNTLSDLPGWRITHDGGEGGDRIFAISRPPAYSKQRTNPKDEA